MAKGKIHFVIVAAGGGSRFGGDIPKQFRQLAGKAVVCHCIDTFVSFCAARGREYSLTVVLSETGRTFWDLIAAEGYSWVKVVGGGVSRAQSVYNAVKSLQEASDNDYVFVHDAARPLVSERILDELISACDAGAVAVVPVIEPTDSLMEVASSSTAIPVSRSLYRAVQTPQAFEYRCLTDAYNRMQETISAMTDDASVVFAATGRAIEIVPGEPRNLKITHSSDLLIAEQLLGS